MDDFLNFSKLMLTLIAVIISITAIFFTTRLKHDVSYRKKITLLYGILIGMVLTMTSLLYFRPLQEIQSPNDDPNNQTDASPQNIIIETTVLQNAWAKSGYYLPIENNLKLNVNSVSAAKVQARVSGPTEQHSFSIIPGQTYVLQIQGIEYRIKLESVGRAGINPFTKAAYFSVVKQEKAEH